jgi:hypothetical protein
MHPTRASHRSHAPRALDGVRVDVRARALLAVCALLAAMASTACATVKPHERAALADPTMQFEAEPHEGAALSHAIDNREGSTGATGVSGGGCGCN